MSIESPRRRKKLVIIGLDDAGWPDVEKYVTELRSSLPSSAGVWVRVLKLEAASAQDAWKRADKSFGDYFNGISGFTGGDSTSVDADLVEAWNYARLFSATQLPIAALDNKLLSSGKLPSLGSVFDALGLPFAGRPMQEESVPAATGVSGSKGETTIVKSPPTQIGEGNVPQPSPLVEPGVPAASADEISRSESSSESLAAAKSPMASSAPAAFTLTAKDVETIKEVRKRTHFVGPENCKACFYYTELNRRCGLFHLEVPDPAMPLCRIDLD